MTQKLILVLNYGSFFLRDIVLDNDSGEVLLNRLTEKLNLPDVHIIFRFNGEEHKVDPSAKPDRTGAVEALMGELKARGLDIRIGVIGHRVVSDSELYSESILVTDGVIADIEKRIPLVPLRNLARPLDLRATQTTFKGLPSVIVFGTAFHQAIPERAYEYTAPCELYEKYGSRRYSAYGTSYCFVADETARFLGRDKEDLHIVIAHPGNGTSITAAANDQSQDINMGLIPLEGLVTDTRNSDIDPVVSSFLAEDANMTISQITEMLSKKSGLLGVSGLSNDCRTTEEEAAKGHPGAKLALEILIYRLAKYIGNMTVTAGGLNVLVFTGGIGENSNIIRERVLGYLDFLGLRIGQETNLKARFDNTGVITTADSRTVAAVIPTNEELVTTHNTTCLSSL